jgi:hypothetical protein
MAGTVAVTAEEFASSRYLSRYPKLYKDVLKPLKDKDDAYVLEVLETARCRDFPLKWQESFREWENELETFLSGRRGAHVFKEFLRIPYVRATAKERFDTLSDDGFFLQKRTIKLSNANRAWTSLGHALADLKLTQQLQILLEEVPESGEIRVSELGFVE